MYLLMKYMQIKKNKNFSKCVNQKESKIIYKTNKNVSFYVKKKRFFLLLQDLLFQVIYLKILDTQYH